MRLLFPGGKGLLFVFLVIGSVQPVFAQPMEVSNDPPITPINLITNVFLGQGVEVLNVQYQGSDDAVGFFKNGEDEIGIDRGIVMTSGRAVTSGLDYGVDAPGSNFASENNFSTATDPDLLAIAGGFSVNNVSKYIITFIPISDTLRFRYSFGSEEYPEFACTQYNDIFGFFISGPGINGPYTNNAENIARIPGTNLPVTINNVNPGVPGGSGGTVGNCTPPNGSLAFSNFYNNNNGSSVMPVYDGFTDVFTAEAVVQPCSTYTIKLVIADVSDSAYDSGVFLEAKSFGTGSLDVKVETLSLDGSLAEGCDPGYLTFYLPVPTEADYPIDFTIVGTATPGDDYSPVPSELVIPAGDSSLTVPIFVFEDGIEEDPETILIDVQRDPCNRDTFVLVIKDNPLVPADLGPDISICTGDSVQLDGTLPVPAPVPPTFSNTTPLEIFTHNTPFFSDIEVSGVAPPILGPNVIRSICIDSLAHRWIDDLDIYLISPGGQFIELTTDNGGNGGNNLGIDYYLHTCFTPDATVPINFPGPQAGPEAVPFTGEWLPEGVWSDLWDGENPTNGTWSLQIFDDAFNITGTLYSWTITFNPVYDIFYSWEPTTGLSCTDCPNPIAKPTETTTYVMTATDSYGCSVYDTITVEVLTPPETPSPTCGTITDNSITINWAPVSGATGYEVSVDSTAWVPASEPEGHTVTGLSLNQVVHFAVRAIGDCPGEIVTLTCQTPDCTPPTLTGTSAEASCAGLDDGTITLSATGGLPPYLFSVAGQTNATGIFTGLPAGDYTAQVVDGNDCPASMLITVGEAVMLEVETVMVSPTSCFGAVDGSATAMVNGGTPPYQFNWSSAEVDSLAVALPAGLNTVTVTDANGCEAIREVTIPQPEVLTLTFDALEVSCAGAGDGSAIVIPAGGTPPYAFMWDENTGFQPRDTAFTLSGGLYAVTVTDANGCLATGSTMVDEDPPIELTTEGTDALCYGAADGTATVQAEGGAGGFTYVWSNGQSATTATSLAAGEYFVIATDADQCRDTAFVSIAQPDSLSYTFSTGEPACTGGADGTASVTVTGGTPDYAYQWSDQGAPGLADRNDLSAGTYSVVVIDQNNCTETVDLAIDDPEPVTLELTATLVSCNGGSDGTATVTAAGGAGGYTYLWENGQTAATADGLSAGSALVTVTDANGCEASGEVMVEENTALVLSVTPSDPLCFGAADGEAAVSVEGGVGPYSYQWSNGLQTQTTTGLPAGEHTLTVTDANGCQAEATFMLGEPAPLDISFTTTLVTCSGQPDGTATAVPAGGTPPYSYYWDDPAGQLSPTATGLTVGQFSVLVTDANGCMLESSVVVEGIDAISLAFSATDVSCFDGQDGAIEATVNGGSGNYHYEWSDPSVPNTGSPANLRAGVYSLTVTDEIGCEGSGSVTISQPALLSASNEKTDVSCAGALEGAIDLSVSGGVIPYSYQWSNGSDQEDPDQLGAGSYGVTVTDANGCLVTLETNISEPAPLEVSFTVDPVDCYGDATGMLEAEARGGVGGYVYQWSDGGQGTQIENRPAGLYTLSVTDANDCLFTEEIELPQPAAPVSAVVTAETVTCFGDRDGRISLAPSGGTPFYLYSLDGQDYGSSPVFIGLEPGDYTAWIRDVKGCIWTSDNIEVGEPAPIEVDLGPDITLKYGESTILQPSIEGGVGPFQYEWSPADTARINCPDCREPLVRVLDQTSFLLEITDVNGCTGEDRITLFISKERDVYVPTGFSPNDDNMNDRLIVHGKEGTRILLFRIFDRWGELIYETTGFPVNDESAGWDGTFRGEPAESGVYIWQIEIEYPDGSTEVLSGGTTLIR